MNALPGVPTHLTITLRLEASPALLAAIAELGQCLVQHFLAASPGSSASAAPAAGDGAMPSRDVSSLKLPASADIPPSPAFSEAKEPRQARRNLTGEDNWRTAARAEVMRRRYPAGVAITDIRTELNTLPGPEVIRTKHDIANWAFSLGLRRPPGTPNRFLKSDAPPAPVVEASAAQSPDPAKSVDVAAEPVDVSPDPIDALPPPVAPVTPELPRAADPVVPALPTWTDQRKTLLRLHYRTRASDLLLQHINALPGAPISEAWMHGYATGVFKFARKDAAIDAPAAKPQSPKGADQRTIEAWCANRGWRLGKFDLDRINRECARLGHPGFTLVEAPSRHRAAGAA